MTWGHKALSCFSSFLVSSVGRLMPGVFSHGSIHGLREDNLIFQFSRPYGHKLRNFAEALLLQIYTLIWSPQPHDHEQLVIY